MSRKVLIVIDVQHCFLEGGTLAVGGPESPQRYTERINQLIQEGNFSDVVFTQDVHHPENVSLMNIDEHKNWKKKEGYIELPTGLPLRLGMYKGREIAQKRRWGGDLTAQVLWPRHCIIRRDDPYFPADYRNGPMGQNKVGDDFGSDLAFDLKKYANASDPYYEKSPRATIYQVYKGFDKDADSYSAIADALGRETPFVAAIDGKSQAPERKKFTTLLTDLNKNGGISDIYICGIATDFCVYQTTMDLIDLWMFKKVGNGNVEQNKPKVHLIYDLTRTVTPPGADMHKSDRDYRMNVSNLLKNINVIKGNASYDLNKYFVVEHFKEVMKSLSGKNVNAVPPPKYNNMNVSSEFSRLFRNVNTSNLNNSGLSNIGNVFSNNGTNRGSEGNASPPSQNIKSPNAEQEGGRRKNRNKTRKMSKKNCWPKMKGGKKTRKPAGHKKGCKCVVCRR